MTQSPQKGCIPKNVGSFSDEIKGAPGVRMSERKSRNLERASVLAELEPPPWRRFLSSLSSPFPLQPSTSGQVAGCLGGRPQAAVQPWWCRSGKGSELEGLPPYLWKKAGKIQLKAEGSRGGQGLSEVTLPWPDDDQLWEQPRAAWPGSSL